MTTPYVTPGLVDLHAALFPMAALNDVCLVADDDGSQHGSIYRGNGATWVPFLLTPATIQPSVVNGQILTTVAGVTTWAAGGFVPLSATVQGTAPIQIAGDNAPHDLSVPRTWSVSTVSSTTSGVAPAITAAATIHSSVGGVTSAWNTLATLGIVATSLTLTTTTPLRINGGASADLSVNRTLSILPSVTNGDVLTTVGGVVVWQAPAGGFVPTSRTFTGTAPITINGVNTPVDLSTNITVAINNVSSSGPGAAGIITAAGTIFSSPLGVVGSWNTPATLGIVTTSYTISTSGPITLDGTPGGSDTLASAHTIGVLSATTSGLGVVQLTHDLDGTATAPDVIAATGASGTFTVRCTNLVFATSGTITTATSLSLVTSASSDMFLSSARAIGVGASTAIALTSGGTSDISANSARNVVLNASAGNEIQSNVNGTQALSVTVSGGAGKLRYLNHTTTVSPDDIDGSTMGMAGEINGVSVWVLFKRQDGGSTPP